VFDQSGYHGFVLGAVGYGVGFAVGLGVVPGIGVEVTAPAHAQVTL